MARVGIDMATAWAEMVNVVKGMETVGDSGIREVGRGQIRHCRHLTKCLSSDNLGLLYLLDSMVGLNRVRLVASYLSDW